MSKKSTPHALTKTERLASKAQRAYVLATLEAVYAEHAPRLRDGGPVCAKTFALMTPKAINTCWDYPMRHLAHRVAKSIGLMGGK